jgi:hypothetical protein
VIDCPPLTNKRIRVSKVDATKPTPIVGDIERVDMVNGLVPLVIDLPLGPGPDALPQAEITDPGESLESLKVTLASIGPSMAVEVFRIIVMPGFEQ